MKVAEVTVRFLGPLRLFLGEGEVRIQVGHLDEVRRYLEDRYGPLFREKLRLLGVKKVPSWWEYSLFLLNGRGLGKDDNPLLKDGDRIDWGLTFAGG